MSHRATAMEAPPAESNSGITPHPWGILFTILGTVLLDFDADACQSPARAYLLDVTIPGKYFHCLCKSDSEKGINVSDDHARGLSTFTVMAGLGGFMGYSLGGINWDATFIGKCETLENSLTLTERR